MITTLALTVFAHAGAFNDWTGEVKLPGNTASVQLVSVEGDVELTVDPALTSPVVRATDYRPGRACQLTVVKGKRGKTEVRFGPKDLEDPRLCKAEFEIAVPQAMAVSVDLGLGDLVVGGVDGDLRVSVAKGSVTLTDQSGPATVAIAEGDLVLQAVTGAVAAEVHRGRLSGVTQGPMTARVGEGNIELAGLTNMLQADTGVGNILVAFAALPAEPLLLNAGNGHVVVDLPNSARVSPRMSSMTGTTTCELPAGDELEVVAVAGMGSVRVH